MRSRVKKEVEKLKEDLDKLKKLMEKWIPRINEDWQRLKHNAGINFELTEKQIKNETEAFVKILDDNKALEARIEKIEKQLPNGYSLKKNVVFPTKPTHEDEFPEDGHYETPESVEAIRKFEFNKHPKYWFNGASIPNINDPFPKVIHEDIEKEEKE